MSLKKLWDIHPSSLSFTARSLDIRCSSVRRKQGAYTRPSRVANAIKCKHVPAFERSEEKTQITND
jgi:hypothetical protein